jgi:hypothetical protein
VQLGDALGRKDLRFTVAPLVQVRDQVTAHIFCAGDELAGGQ